MTSTQVRRLLGDPDRTGQAEVPDTIYRYWHYADGTDVKFADGKVTEWDHREESQEKNKQGARERRQQRPPSSRNNIPPWAPRDAWLGQVTDVDHGDTFDVREGDETLTIRLQGVDCPESDQPYGGRATRFTRSRIGGNRVLIDPVEEGPYGRTIAHVYPRNQTTLGAMLVGSGMAWWYKEYAPDNRKLARLQKEAQRKRRGL